MDLYYYLFHTLYPNFSIRYDNVRPRTLASGTISLKVFGYVKNSMFDNQLHGCNEISLLGAIHKRHLIHNDWISHQIKPCDWSFNSIIRSTVFSNNPGVAGNCGKLHAEKALRSTSRAHTTNLSSHITVGINCGFDVIHAVNL